MDKKCFGKQFKNNKGMCSGNMDKVISYESLHFSNKRYCG